MTLLDRLLATAIAAALMLALTVSAHAQEPAAPPEEPAAEASAEQAPAEEAAPEVPARLTDPAIPVDELVLRLIPLTADQLAALADDWLGIVQVATEQVTEKQIEINAADEAPDPALLDQLTELTARRADLFEKYSSVVDSLEKKGGAPEAVAGYRAYRNAIIVEETQAADWRTLLARTISWMTDRDGGVQVLLNTGVIVASFLALLIVARIVRRIARRWLGRVPDLSKLLQAFLVLAIYWLTIAFGLMIVLSAVGIDVTPLFALVGGASFIMAFALQDTLGNLASGLMIMMNRPFDEGDYVDIAGTAGTVKSVSVVSTTVTTPDNQVIVVPNSKVWGNVITNVTASDTRRVDLVFGIGYDDSIEDAQRVLEDTVQAHPLILKEPEPIIRVNGLGASSVDFICRPWVKSADYWTVYWDLTRQVKENFDRAGISIPFPQTDMHIHMANDTAPPLASSTVTHHRTEPELGDTPAERYAAGDEASDDQPAR
jgi:small conductance mechanosensitive channel